MSNNCLILGGGGFIGSHLAEELLAKNFNVSIFDKLNFSHRNISHIEDKLSILEGDFNNEVDLRSSLKGIDYVFHLVSSTLPASSNENPIYDVESNLISTLQLLDECVKQKVKKVIFISSGGTVYGIPEIIPIPENHHRLPLCSYGIVKKSIEDYLFLYKKLFGLNYCVFRLANPYGERQNPSASQGAVTVFLYKALMDETIEIWGDGSVTRDYIYIKDVVKVLTDALSVNHDENIFNIGSGKGHTLNEIVEIIRKVTQKEVKVKYTKSRKLDVPINILDSSRAESSFNWKASTSLNDGMLKTYNYLKSL